VSNLHQNDGMPRVGRVSQGRSFRENYQMTQTLRDSEKPSEPVEPQKIIEERQVPTAPQKQPQERPSGCQHFFGYLRNMPKNTLIPDECLGCSKMVECLYHTILE